MATALLKEFGTLGGILVQARSPRFLKLADESVAATLGAIHDTLSSVLQSRVEDRPLLSTSEELRDYLRLKLAFEQTEHVRALHLNTRNILIADEVIARGSLNGAAIYTREVVSRALELRSASIILAHNHPSGDPHPSAADVHFTREFIKVSEPLGITLVDHVIVARGGFSSMRELRLI